MDHTVGCHCANPDPAFFTSFHIILPVVLLLGSIVVLHATMISTITVGMAFDEELSKECHFSGGTIACQNVMAIFGIIILASLKQFGTSANQNIMLINLWQSLSKFQLWLRQDLHQQTGPESRNHFGQERK